jgi:CRP-like cAMP-binding protein
MTPHSIFSRAGSSDEWLAVGSPRLRASGRLAPAERAALLAEAPLFAPLAEEELQALAEGSQVRCFGAGEVLFHERDPANALYLIHSGQVKITRDNLDGEETILHVIGGGECLGELALLDGGTRSATAVALGPVVALRLCREELLALVEERPAVAKAVITILAAMVRRVTDQLQDLMLLDVPGRLARTLLVLAARHGRPTARGVRIGVRLTQAELAQMVGTTRPTISTQMSRLRERGVISVDREGIVLHEPERLRKRVEQGGLPCP